jgi:hypothetical protein
MSWFATSIHRFWRSTWHSLCVQISCQTALAFESLRALVPQQVDPRHLLNPSAFQRQRKLPYPRLITTVLSLAAGGKSTGVQTKVDELFRGARRSGLWKGCDGLHRSAVTKARAHVSWTAFEEVFHRSVDLALSQLRPSNEYLWHGMSVYAIDGSKYTLPASEELRAVFDPDSGFQHGGKGHFPQCLVSTAVDVFRHIPVARTVAPANTSERAEAALILPRLPSRQIAMYDRGYPSYDFIDQHRKDYNGYFLFRCPATSTFGAVQRFIKSGKEEDTIWIVPSGHLQKCISLKDKISNKAIKLRVIKLKSPDGTLSVLLTNLFGEKRFTREEIINLYFRRWAVETYYRDEKETLRIETFHSTSSNGIRQELFASAAMATMTHILSIKAAEQFPSSAPTARPQFKNALITLAHEAAILVPVNPIAALTIFDDILRSIAKVKYYRPKKPRPSRPRVCKKPPNKWTFYRARRMTHA